MKKAFLLAALTTAALLQSASGETSLTIYNNNFAIIRDTLKLDLKAGVNDVRYSDVALFAEPSSVILRDPRFRLFIWSLPRGFTDTSPPAAG